VSLTVAIDTTDLATQSAPPAPFSLDLQLIDGGGTATNAATLSHFDFGGGSTTAADCTSATCVDGASVTGPPLVIALTDDPSLGGGFLNEVVLPFTPGSSGPLSFQLDLTTNLEMGVGVSPDAFTVAILDSSGFGIPTDFFDVFVQIDITSPLTIATFASDASQSPGIDIPAPLVRSAAAPEPGTLFLFAIALAGIALAGSAPRHGPRAA
jgi:hypothetical protein